MTNQELATCVHHQLPVKVAVVNNGTLGMVRQWQSLFHDRVHSQTDLTTRATRPSPDITALASAYGCLALRCDRPQDVDDVVRAAAAERHRPAVIEFVVSDEAMVWPMVPAGVANDDILVAAGQRPDFGDDQ